MGKDESAYFSAVLFFVVGCMLKRINLGSIDSFFPLSLKLLIKACSHRRRVDKHRSGSV